MSLSKQRPYTVLSSAKSHESHYASLQKRIASHLIEDDIIDTTVQHYELSEGDVIYRNMVKCITDTKDIKLMDFQLRLVRTCIVPALPGMYGNEFTRRKDVILKDHGITKMYNEVLFLSSRRMGKTLTLSFTATTFALCIPSDGIRPMMIAVFSVTRESAEQFIKECASALRCLKYIDQFDIEVKSREIIFRNKNDSRDVRIIRTYCGRGDVSTFIVILITLLVQRPSKVSKSKFWYLKHTALLCMW